MRYYLDTNIISFLLFNPDDLDRDVSNIVSDYSNSFYTSSVCVMELVQLILRYNEKRKRPIDHSKILDYLHDFNVEIQYVCRSHLMAYTSMPVLHSDPNDRLIIAQAASDKITLISSDLQFAQYQSKLKDFKFVLNKR